MDKSFIGNTQITIKAKKAVNVENISVAPKEQEVLFRPDTKFKVLAKEKNADGINEIVSEKRNRLIWQIIQRKKFTL